MTEAELNTALDKMTEQTGKIALEQSNRFDALVAANKVLQDIIDAGGVGGTITQATVDAAARVQTALDNLDAAIPDAPV